MALPCSRNSAITREDQNYSSEPPDHRIPTLVPVFDEQEQFIRGILPGA